MKFVVPHNHLEEDSKEKKCQYVKTISITFCNILKSVFRALNELLYRSVLKRKICSLNSKKKRLQSTYKQ